MSVGSKQALPGELNYLLYCKGSNAIHHQDIDYVLSLVDKLECLIMTYSNKVKHLKLLTERSMFCKIEEVYSFFKQDMLRFCNGKCSD